MSSVVVCTRYRRNVLLRCLDGLAQLDHPSYEVIVVDNSTGDAETVELAAQFSARYVLEPRRGLSRARNAGARVARGKIVAFADDDAVPDRGWLSVHAAALEDRTLAATTGRVVPVDHESDAGVEDLGERPFRVDRHSDGWFERANFGGIGLGSNLALSRQLFITGWGFREDLGLGYGILGEEHYAFFELLRAGYAIAYLPDAIVRHQPEGERSTIELRTRRTLRASSAYMFMLLLEERGYRRRTFRYALEALRGRRRPWRNVEQNEPFGTWRERLAAALAGPAIYVSNRLSARRHAARRSPPPPAQ